MAANYDQLLNLKIPDSRQTYSAHDVMRYALSLGIGADPTDAAQLKFVYEKNLQALPTFGVVLAHPGFWARDLDTGIDWKKIVHAEQGLILHQPLPTAASVIGRSRIVDIIDKGEGKGALVYYERTIVDANTDALICTSTQTVFCRGDGGIGGPQRSAPAPHLIAQRAPDYVCEIKTLPQMALLYRLNGDMNPLHADPEIAQQAGFERPILQGLATFGIAGYALIKTLCEYDAARIAQISARFTAPVFPGETLRVDLWRDANEISFVITVVERNVIAINNGRAALN
ncbi:MAG: enoyl-CoA hydratase 2, peroxisomal-like [Verrucomicrobiaceae bacterium]|nr:enoyl-CoA hydratase 2, peroxisomal-like [Verrucomicrobiaceae bacterium]